MKDINNKIIKHKPDCKMVFGRKDKTCLRCQELLNGAKPRDGWQKFYYENKKKNDDMRARAIAEHDCSVHPRGFICTAFEW